MVSLSEIQASNSRISSTLAPGLVALFVGATGGVGEFTLKKFAQYSNRPRIYFAGRSQTAADRITAELKDLELKGTQAISHHSVIWYEVNLGCGRNEYIFLC